MSMVRTERIQDVKRIMAPFEESLKELDNVHGFSLHKVWEECLRVHDSHTDMYANIAQMEVMLQAQSRQWAKQQGVIAAQLKELNPQDKNFIKQTESLLKLNESMVGTITKLNRTIKDVKREIRAAEFQSKFLFHVNDVQTFMVGLTGILMQTLQNVADRDYVLDQVRHLAKIFGTDRAREIVVQELAD